MPVNFFLFKKKQYSICQGRGEKITTRHNYDNLLEKAPFEYAHTKTEDLCGSYLQRAKKKKR
jgi:predicted RNA-binding protein associated with RNAse of E/G family